MKKNLFKKGKKLISIRRKGFESLVLTRSILNNFCLCSETKRIGFFLAQLKKNENNSTFVTGLTSQCYLTWRSGSVYSFFRLTRLTLRDEFSFGRIKGLRKSSW